MGTPPVRALFFEFPDEPDLFSVDNQFLIGDAILVTPVLEPNTTSVQGKSVAVFALRVGTEAYSFSGRFPGHAETLWRDWYTHEVVSVDNNGQSTLSAPLGHINVHVRDGTALLLHSKPEYTIEETLQTPYSLLVSIDARGSAFGSAYIDDGLTSPPGPSRTVTFSATSSTPGKQRPTGRLTINGQGRFSVRQNIEEITILGISTRPRTVRLNGKAAKNWTYSQKLGELTIGGMDIDLNEKQSVLEWN